MSEFATGQLDLSGKYNGPIKISCHLKDEMQVAGVFSVWLLRSLSCMYLPYKSSSELYVEEEERSRREENCV